MRTFHVWGLMPELSRTDVRPWGSKNQQNLHETAKRARLERFAGWDAGLFGYLRVIVSRRCPTGTPNSVMTPTLSIVFPSAASFNS